MSAIKTKAELNRKLKLLELTDEEQIKNVVCSLIGHSRIQTVCFGYYNCARCGDQLGDNLAGGYSGAEEAVIVGHKCGVCEKNYEKCTWRDTFMVPDPFAKD